MAETITLEGLIEKLSAGDGKRILAGIAGAPGSGKSTIAARLKVALNLHSPSRASILPMDGFHFDDGLLKTLGRLSRKGAPDTFDVGGLHQTLVRLRENTEEAIAVPVFDRDLEISRGSARLIARSVQVIIIEGNYLLLADEPWASLKDHLDLTVMVRADEATLRRRLTARWEGYQLPTEEIHRKVEENDLPNGQLVVARSAVPDFFMQN